MDPNELRLRLSLLELRLDNGEYESAHEVLTETLYDLDNPPGDSPPGPVVFLRDNTLVFAPVSGETNAFDAKGQMFVGPLADGEGMKSWND